MSPFPQPLNSRAAPLLVDNVDTDTIIPSREMRSTGRTGLADGLFAPRRYSDADARVENPDFVLNRPEYRDATILLGGANFGCGSSREHAVWALAEWGFRCVIAESFAPIFRGNCVRNGILPVVMPREVLEALAGEEVTVDIDAQEVAGDGETHPFAIDAEAKQMLAEGLDAIDLTLTQRDDIAAWIAADRARRPWVYLEKQQ
ncbi:3-isopropylmalate dehydratase small subunit [Aurantiacibacter aquimixticola]|uniref:3-isopropylmalate dehydratase small subunit n=1 Tax=Aurantiacibacter aquimixticola TaxID=1958945 RepID=A0A419RW53_9SPHN|nr:3-isopropylmalate dehydratase small subunit [Aurantiacibacter aquimixticola]RJY10030.1 3-isopropylmalate dehydratase small subunit [Aurantiacibacter aquimixticola]